MQAQGGRAFSSLALEEVVRAFSSLVLVEGARDLKIYTVMNPRSAMCAENSRRPADVLLNLLRPQLQYAPQ